MNKVSITMASLFFINYTIWSIESIRLTDVIKSNGSGLIDLFKDIDAQQLEEYRLANNGKVILGIDVNEAASGTEKSSSQAVTIKNITFHIELNNGEVYNYHTFETETKATVAEVGSTQRYTYFTSLGDAGSNRITASNSIQNVFDSTIKVEVPIDLSSAVKAELQIELLETNQELGDPESFYDFSNGFEDLAMLNETDSSFLDELAAGRDEAPAVELTYPENQSDLDVSSTLFYPSSSNYYTVAYEDLFPSKGDYDFNDLVVAYQVFFHLNSNNKLVKISGSSVILAKGAAFDHDWRLKIDLPNSTTGSFSSNLFYPASDGRESVVTNKEFSGSFNETIFANTQNLYPVFNTFVENTFHQGARATFEINLNTSVPLSQVSTAPFDAYLFVHDTQYEIHRVGFNASEESFNISNGKTSFIDENGFPFAMLLPTLWSFPFENRDLGEAYPGFINYILSGSSTNLNWYSTPAATKTKNYTFQDFVWWEE